MKLKIAQVVGLNTDQKAAQVISSVQDQENTFLGVIMLSSDDAFTKGRAALSELSDFYFEYEGSPSEKLNAAFEQAVKVVGEDVQYDLLLGSISGKILYLIAKGEMEVFLKRSAKLSQLLAVGSASQLISGFLTDGDKLFFSTKTLVTFLGQDLESALDLAPDTFEEEIESRIGASTLEDQGLAALIIEVESKIQPEIANLPTADLPQPPLYQPEEEADQPATGPIFNKILAVLGGWRNYFPKSGRGRLIVGIILIILIATGVGFKYQQSKSMQKQLQFNQLIQGAKDDFDAAKGLATLNPAGAKNKLDSAKTKISQALVLKPNDSLAQQLKTQIDSDASSILQQSSVTNFPLFLDMELIKKNFRANNFSLSSSNQLLLLDPAVGTLVKVDVSKKSNQILAGSEQLGEATFGSLNGDLAFIYSKDKGILRLDTTNQKITTVAKSDSDWGQIANIYGFAGNVYLLDTQKNMIWKYLPTADGYSDKREYFSKGTKFDLSGSISMQIESSVYVLKNSGEILRFTKGDKDNFSLSGLPSAVKNPKSFFVSSDTDNLYLLDSGNSRLLILTKTGSYKGEITGSEFAQATDLVVDEKGKKVYLLDGSKIYAVDLK